MNVSEVLPVRTGKEICDAFRPVGAAVFALTRRVASTLGRRRVYRRVMFPDSIVDAVDLIGTIDMVIQRAIELLQAIPRIPLWLTLSAALTRDWGTVEVYFGITIILSVLGWTGLARTVRGKFLALREEDFTQAAKYLGASEMRIIIRHMVPSFSSHLIAVLTLRVPEMILAETSLSFRAWGCASR